MSGESLFRQPGAFGPVAMSLAALLVVVVRIAIIGTGPEPDEGTAAHLWQLLMAGQVPVIAYFAIKWLPRAPGPALAVLVMQGVAGLMAAAPVFLLKL